MLHELSESVFRDSFIHEFDKINSSCHFDNQSLSSLWSDSNSQEHAICQVTIWSTIDFIAWSPCRANEEFSNNLLVIYDCEVMAKVLSGELSNLHGWVKCDPEYERARLKAQEQEMQQGIDRLVDFVGRMWSQSSSWLIYSFRICWSCWIEYQ